MLSQAHVVAAPRVLTPYCGRVRRKAGPQLGTVATAPLPDLKPAFQATLRPLESAGLTDDSRGTKLGTYACDCHRGPDHADATPCSVQPARVPRARHLR